MVFVTNNAYPDRAGHEAKLAAIGIDATGAVLEPDGRRPPARARRAGARGRRRRGGEAVSTRAAVVDYDELDAGSDPVTTVVVGFHPEFDYAKMRIASTAVRGRARFVATNVDPTYPTERGEVPGNGAIVAGIATAAGTDPTSSASPTRRSSTSCAVGAATTAWWWGIGPTPTACSPAAGLALRPRPHRRHEHRRPAGGAGAGPGAPTSAPGRPAART